MECPKCGSSSVERLPPSQISPHPGYRCNNCGIKMRSHGMLFVYIFTFVVGAALCFLCGWLLVEAGGGDRPIRVAWLGVIGIVVAGYSVMQIFRPVPRRGSEADRSDAQSLE
jgi:DNA-directed RNA polymerase subunit RPC12/RpoP